MSRLYFKILGILCAAFLFCGVDCDNIAGAQWGVWVRNDSDKDVYFVFSFDVIDGNYYPSVEWPKEPTVMGFDIHLFKPHEERPIDYSAQRMKFSPDDRVALFVFDPDTVAKYTWEQLEADENYLKKYIFAGRELRSSFEEFIITYP